MGKPKAPAAPSPIATGAAQTSTNISTAIANQLGAMVNQNGPYGSLSYDQTGTFRFTDPNSGKTYDLPRFTQTTALSPDGKYLQDRTTATQKNLANLSVTQSGRLQQLMGQPFSLAGVPGRTAVPGAQTVAAPGAGSLQRVAAPQARDWSQDRQRVEGALMSRLAPQIARDRASLDNTLRQQGLVPGTAAYERAMQQQGQQATDARMQAILAGGQEQSRMAGLQNQTFGQQVTAAGVNNAAQGQLFGQQMGAAGMNNAARMDAWRAQEAARAAGLNEAFQMRSQPINEIMALQAGAQVQNPTFGATPGLNVPTTDYAGLIQQNYANRMGQYQQQMGAWNGLWGNILGTGAKVATGMWGA